MAKYDVRDLAKRYNAILKRLSKEGKTPDMERQRKELLKYAGKYGIKGLTGNELKSVSMIILDIQNMAKAQEKKKGKRLRLLSAATATVERVSEGSTTVQNRPTLLDRARERAGYEGGPSAAFGKEKRYAKISNISDLTIKLAPTSKRIFTEMNVELTSKRISGVEMSNGKVKIEDGMVYVRITDSTGEIKVVLDPKSIIYTKDGKTVEGMTVDEFVNGIKKNAAEVSVKGVLKETRSGASR